MIYLPFFSVGQDIRDRFSGAVEVFSRRNGSSSAHYADHSRRKAVENGPMPSKETVWQSWYWPFLFADMHSSIYLSHIKKTWVSFDKK